MAERVVLAMSGGVDSSAAAVLLHEQGYEVIGLFMRSGETESACALPTSGLLPVVNAPAHRQGCCSSEDAADARRVADRMGIPFYSLNLQDAFRRIKDYFADEYLAGRTPNPCVQCNNWLKFGKLWEFAQQVDANYIATGHYARILPQASVDGETTADWGLFRGDDDNKDQSYVLFGIRRELLPNILLPIGTFQKPEIRELARESGLRVADKKDSYEICFVPDQDYAGFLKRYRGVEGTAGDFVDMAGNVLGQHEGYEHFTVGQRKGLGIAFGEPRFVVRIDPQTRQVILGQREDLATSRISVHDLNWLADRPSDHFRCEVKVRYRQKSEPCVVEVTSENLATVVSDSPIFGVAPGQAAVFYDGDRVLGGGWISSNQ
jgi:tRNA-specific 2-thiouridylase